MAPIILNIAFFVCISVAALKHFDPKSKTTGFAYIRILSLILSVGMIYISVIYLPLPQVLSIISILITGLASLIFFYAVKETRGQNLGLAFDRNHPSELITSGIYAHVRNPFYLSYILYWLSWVFVSQFSIISILGLSLFLILYLKSIKVEEQSLASSFGKDYEEYRVNVGCFLPRVKK